MPIRASGKASAARYVIVLSITKGILILKYEKGIDISTAIIKGFLIISMRVVLHSFSFQRNDKSNYRKHVV